jgi:hypothetical protein
MQRSTAAAFLVALAGAAHGADAAPAAFAVPKNASMLYSVEALRSGDVLQVRVRHLLGDRMLVLGRCNDANCDKADVVAVWNHGFRNPNGIDNHVIRSNYAIRQEGRYFLRLIKNSDCYVARSACRSSPWPGMLNYGHPQALPIIATQTSEDWYKAEYESGSWIFVRRVLSAGG